MHGWLAACSMACCDVTGSVGGTVHEAERIRLLQSNDDVTHAVQRRRRRGLAGPLADCWLAQLIAGSVSSSRQDDIASSQQRYRASTGTAAAAAAGAADKSVKLLVRRRALPFTAATTTVGPI